MTPPTGMMVEHYPPGEMPEDVRAADVILVAGKNTLGVFVRLAQRLFGSDMRYAKYTHAALAVSESEVIEAVRGGVKRNPLEEYREAEIALARCTDSEEDRRQMVAFAESCETWRYSYLDLLVGVPLAHLSGYRLVIASAATAICSALCALARTRGNAIFPRPAEVISPAELAEYLDR